jgi:hypothetical protein
MTLDPSEAADSKEGEKLKAHLVYLKSNVTKTKKMADAVNMNPNSFTLNWFSIQCTNEKRYL